MAEHPVAILPMGSTEQHGPTGLCGTDAICAETVAVRAGAYAGVLVLPVLSYAPAQFNLGFPGTVSIKSQTSIAVLMDIYASLDVRNVRRLVILNGHGANNAAIDVAVHDYYAENPETELRIERVAWWELGEVPELRREMFGEGEGLHATPSEISITQAVVRQVKAAAAIEHRKLGAVAIARLAGDRHGPSGEHARAYPDGLVGSDPGLADGDLGHRLLDAAVTGLCSRLSSAG